MRHSSTFMRLQGEFVLEQERHQVLCKLGQGRKKQILLNEVPYEKATEHVGRFPIIVTSPGDHVLIDGGSEDRRRLLNEVLSQLDKAYLKQLIRYRKVLAQRNALLKAYPKVPLEENLMLVYDQQLAESGHFVAIRRKELIEEMIPQFNQNYVQISLNREQVAFQYKTTVFDKPLIDQFLEARQKDVILQRTTVGIHKDDLIFSMEGRPIKRFGSQGQQKTFLLSLKLALFELFKRHKKMSPILLLDDIFDKLDPERMASLLSRLKECGASQIVISDTQVPRLADVFDREGISFRHLSVQNGTCHEEV